MAGVLYRLGRLCVRRAAVVVAIWLFLAVAVHVVVWRVGAETSNDLSLPGTESSGQERPDGDGTAAGQANGPATPAADGRREPPAPARDAAPPGEGS